MIESFFKVMWYVRMNTTLCGDDTSVPHAFGRRYLEGSKEYGKYEKGQHQKRRKSFKPDIRLVIKSGEL